MFHIGSSRKFNYVILSIYTATRNMHIIIDILHNIREREREREKSHIFNNYM